MGKQLLELFRTSAIIQGLMALGFSAACIYLACIGQPLPDFLVGITGAIVGYYFGTKVSQLR